MKNPFYIDPDIRKAETLPAAFYRDGDIFNQLKSSVFSNSWQWIGDNSIVPFENSVHPFFFMEHFLDEPMILIRDATDKLSCLSNVCTHRANIVVQNPGKMSHLQCMYHGRKFDLQGNFQFMPEFKEADNFPRPCDNLKKFETRSMAQHLFTSINPSFDFQKVIDRIMERMYFLPFDECKHDTSRSKDYLVQAHWALYCDNYLEGFHIPFVHNDLNAALDYGKYTTEIYDYCNLQIGYSNHTNESFQLPKGHPDSGKNVSAYYYWVYPNMMFNFYPWGLSINIVKPISIDRTRVSFISYVWDESKIDQGAGAILDKVEREDEFVVEGVQRGVRSRAYTRGRFSPKREKGVHQFHQMLSNGFSH